MSLLFILYSFLSIASSSLQSRHPRSDCRLVTGQRKTVHDFACLLEDHMQDIPEESWHNFEIECLTLVQRFRQATQLSWQTHQQPHINISLLWNSVLGTEHFEYCPRLNDYVINEAKYVHQLKQVTWLQEGKCDLQACHGNGWPCVNGAYLVLIYVVNTS